MALQLPAPILHGLGDAQTNFDALSRQSPQLVTALPANPFDGQIVDYLADDTNGILWRLRYRATSASSFKWEFIGGSRLHNEQTATATINVTTYSDLNSGTPALTLPLAGDYDLLHGCRMSSATATADLGWQTIKVGSETAADTYAVLADGTTETAAEGSSGSIARRVTGVSASTVAKCQYKSVNRVISVESRWLWAIPIRVG